MDKLLNITPTEHPHIVKVDGILSGQPVIRGRRVSVRAIVESQRMGMSPDEIMRAFLISPAEVHDALSYYHDHAEEIEQLIERNRIPNELLSKSRK